MKKKLAIRQLGLRDYNDVYDAMRTFTEYRSARSCDEIWLVEHLPVFTLGRRGAIEHILDAGDIPVIHSDRGGQVTYHGPGQLVVYMLLDLQRKNMGILSLVNTIQDSIMALLVNFGIESSTRPDAPGVYVDNRKIASIGLRVRRGCCYHGMSLNIAMDLAPFKRINPCGYAGLEVTQISDLQGPDEVDNVATRLCDYLRDHLGYDNITFTDSAFHDDILLSSARRISACTITRD